MKIYDKEKPRTLIIGGFVSHAYGIEYPFIDGYDIGSYGEFLYIKVRPSYHPYDSGLAGQRGISKEKKELDIIRMSWDLERVVEEFRPEEVIVQTIIGGSTQDGDMEACKCMQIMSSIYGFDVTVAFYDTYKTLLTYYGKKPWAFAKEIGAHTMYLTQSRQLERIADQITRPERKLLWLEEQTELCPGVKYDTEFFDKLYEEIK